jgi:hypothetical protein
LQASLQKEWSQLEMMEMLAKMDAVPMKMTQIVNRPALALDRTPALATDNKRSLPPHPSFLGTLNFKKAGFFC